eukprot:scaffold701_cov158-Amphora_coffeaeformis.AAC.12
MPDGGGDESLLDSETTENEQQQDKKHKAEVNDATAKTEDEPPELAVDRVTDIIDFETEHILWERMSRKDHYESLEASRNIDKGRRFTRRLMAHILMNTCTSNPYGVSADDETEDGDDHKPVDPEPLVKWNVDQWTGLLDSINYLRSLVIRKDAKINYSCPSDVGTDAGLVNSDVAAAPWFTKKFKLLEDQITIHRILAPIRDALEMQARKTGNDKIMKKGLDNVCLQVARLREDMNAKEALLTLFDRDEDGSLTLKTSLSDLKRALDAPPFDLCFFQSSMENCMHRMNLFLSDRKDCALIQARYTIPKASELYRTLNPSIDARVAEASARRRQNVVAMEKAKLDELRRGRAALKSGHGDDPLDAAMEAAQGAKPSADGEDGEKPKDSEKKRKRVPRLKIVEEIEEDEEDEDVNETAAGLSQVPRRKRRSSPGQKDPSPVPPDEGIFNESGKVLKRLRWTDEEKLCVKEGVKVHGVGKWKEIKNDYAAILRNRTPVQIKDCWRTMTKNQEVPFSVRICSGDVSINQFGVFSLAIVQLLQLQPTKENRKEAHALTGASLSYFDTASPVAELEKLQYSIPNACRRFQPTRYSY